MAVTVKATATNATGSANIVLPASIAAGDLILLVLGSYSTVPTLPTGYTQIGSTVTTTATYTDYLMVTYKIAVAGDAGATVTTNMQGAYSGSTALVLTGHDTTTPIHLSATGTTVNSGNWTMGSMTTTKAARRFVFVSEMSNNGTVPVFTTPTGMTNETTTNGSGGYHGVVSYSYNTQEAAGALPAVTLNSNLPGAIEAMAVAVAVGNQAPTLSNLAPSNAASGVVTSTSRFTWTYSDNESNPQTQYEIGYRIKGSGSAFTTVTNTSANAYHDFAANTFTDGTEYEWQLRVNDGVGGWSAYSTAEFTAGTSTWSYGPVTTSATASGKVPDYFLLNGTFENAADTDTWESNSVFGYYTAATFTRSTLYADTGTYSLEVTLPTGTHSWANTYKNGFIPNKQYLVTARVYVPTGTPDVGIDVAFRSPTITKTSVKDAWVTITGTFTASADTHYIGVFADSTTAGQKFYIDNINVREIDLPVGQYYLQVKTSDGAGFGPWSSSTTFTVNPLSNVYVRSGGTWVIAKNNVRVAGIFKQAPPTKKNTGGTF